MQAQPQPDDPGHLVTGVDWGELEARVALIKFLEGCTVAQTLEDISIAAGVVLNELEGLDILK